MTDMINPQSESNQGEGLYIPGIRTEVRILPMKSEGLKTGVFRPSPLPSEDKLNYSGRNAIERFFSWIEANKKIYPRYERLEQSYLGHVLIACSLMLWRI